MMFKMNPDFIMSFCEISPVPKTIAFGGVATGSIKAQEAPKPMISDSPNGASPSSSDIEIKIGTKSAALAVFEVNSVRKTIKNATTSPIVK